ncbi:MAG TPA: glycosyltransferase family 2 protein [Stellaceae bacterium]|nr:glycosyltransferase family 2 protein [Stellaceae bacterium]
MSANANPAPALSALVVARNEEMQLAACLERLRFADEIVVVLDRTDDRSAEIARGFKAKIVEGAWEREGPRRNAGIDACRGPWILEIDSDERATPALAAEIRAAIKGPEDYFLVPMANHIGGKLVRHGWGAYNGVAAKPMLFRKGAKQWGEGRVHPRIALTGTHRALNHLMEHYVDRDLSDMIARLNRYTDLAALDARDAGRRPEIGHALRRCFSRGWKSYVARQGYREGAWGVSLATFSALYSLLTELKLATGTAEKAEKKR